MIEWISISKKVPKKETEILLYGTLNEQPSVFAGWLEFDGEWYCFCQDWCTCCYNPEVLVTHWMEYPKPPIENNKG